jgi:DnaJ-class molecular chaperone
MRKATVIEVRADGRKFGWLGHNCLECHGSGETEDARRCPKCGGTGEAYGEIREPA